MPKTLRSAREDALNSAEAKQLLRACRDTLDHLVVRLPLYCGLRIGEVQHLRRTWVNHEKGLIELPARQLCHCYECRKWREGVWTPKTRAGRRSLLLTSDTEPWLREFFAAKEAIGRSRQALEQRFERIRKRSGLMKPAYPHCLRASFATRLAEEGLSAPSLSYLLGWQGLGPAESYIQSSAKRAHAEQRKILATVK